MKLIHIHHRSTHHAKKSGYSRISDYLPVRSIYGDTGIPYRLAKIFSGFHSTDSGLYDTVSVLKETELFKNLIKTKNQASIVHYLNAERDIRHLLRYKKFFPNTKFCGTFHKPPEVLLETIKKPTFLKNLDAAIAVGENQVDFLKEWLKLENVSFIPHGVDTAFFKPGTQMKATNSLIFVGQHLRDFEILNYCVPRIAEEIKDLKVNVVIHPAYKTKINSHRSINVYSNLNDLDLRDIYNGSEILFLPLKNATACNSLLEGLACGLPIVSTDVGGNRFYLEGTENILGPENDNNYYIDAIINLLRNRDSLREMAISSRTKALDLSWEETIKRLNSFYENLNEE